MLPALKKRYRYPLTPKAQWPHKSRRGTDQALAEMMGKKDHLTGGMKLCHNFTFVTVSPLKTELQWRSHLKNRRSN
jgi:hypothetical protein